MFMNRDVMGSLVSKGKLDPAKFKLVLNRYRNDTSWDLPTIEAYMGLPVFGLIPASQKDALTEADNTGRPFVAAHMGRNDADDERVLKAFISLAGAVCEPVRTLAAERERKQRGLLGRIGKKP
jgi:Flp pilus assembly CpaE family ATPase